MTEGANNGKTNNTEKCLRLKHMESALSSAILLGVEPQILHAFIKRHNIQWRGKGFNYKRRSKSQF